jgi:hypothetical protein
VASFTYTTSIQSASSIPASDGVFTSALLAITALVGTVTLGKLSWTEQSGVVAFEADAADGRVWKQAITFVNASDSDPTMDLVSITSVWHASELGLVGNLRNALVLLRVKYGLSSLVITWS